VTAPEIAGGAMSVLDSLMATLNDLLARLKRIEAADAERAAAAEFSQQMKDSSHEYLQHHSHRQFCHPA
jgi:hypothetical protein